MSDTLLSAPALAAVVAVVMALGKVIELLITRATPKRSILTDEERAMLLRLYELSSKSDPDGVPLIYVPRSLAEIQRDMQHIMTKVVSDQRRIADILERIDNKLQ